MKIVKLLGGLGNQMFQYAFYRALQKRFSNVKADVSGFKNYSLHNGFELENTFSVKLHHASVFQKTILGGGQDIFSRIYRKIGLGVNKFYYVEKKNFHFDEHIFCERSSKYYWGYWQNEKYFSDITAQIREEFTFKNQLSSKNEIVRKQILDSNSVAVHVRRGDYVNHSLFDGLCGPEYYSNAIKYIESRIANPVYFIFSNDIEWCKTNLALTDAHYIDWNTDRESYVDMQLMSLCKHNIIANSSFSWWGAWLNNNAEKIVLAPTKWLNTDDNNQDPIPEQWIKIY